MKSAMMAGALLCGMVLFSLQAQGEIRRIVVDQTTPLTVDPHAGLPAYEKLRGRLFGEVDPRTAQNAIIQDIERAPRNSRGRVEYIATFTLLRPTGSTRSNRVLFAELPNRGNRPDDYSRNATFLRSRGYSILWVGWQGDLAEKPDANGSAASIKLESFKAPRAKGADGSPLIGPYLMRIPSLYGPALSGALMKLEQASAGPLAYFPATYDTSHATLTGGPAERTDGSPSGTRYTLAASEWTWWNCASDAPANTARSPGELCVKRLRGTFKADETYTLTFTARDPIVLGLGMAGIRDAVSFFRYAPSDAAGTPNPLANTIDHVIGAGASQVGNLVRTIIALGFNTDEQGRRVWDGANSHIGGRRAPINHRFAVAGGSPMLYMPGNEGVLWWGEEKNTVRDGKAGSLLDRCRKTHTCPKVFETFGGAELWWWRASSGMVTPDLRRDIPLPANVRRYVFPSTSHGGGGGGFEFAVVHADPGRCIFLPNSNSQTEQMHALFVALTDWVVKGTEPPDSRYPTLARGELVRDLPETLKTPAWPGLPKPHGTSNPLLVYDYGDRFDYADMSGIISKLPPRILSVVPALVPRMDADGNEIGGVASVQLMAPLGSYLSWNIFREGPYAGRLCNTGGFIPFAKTRADRLAVKDDRPSIEERYGTRAGYIRAIKNAVEQAVRERFLLPDDATRLVEEASRATMEGDLSFLP